MQIYYRFKDLQAAGIVSNRMTLSRWIKHCGFPPGVLLGPNTRAWPADEVEAWLKQRKENPPRRGRPKGPEKPKTPTAREVRDREGLTRLLVSLECKVESLETKIAVLEGAA